MTLFLNLTRISRLSQEKGIFFSFQPPVAKNETLLGAGVANFRKKISLSTALNNVLDVAVGRHFFS